MSIFRVFNLILSLILFLLLLFVWKNLHRTPIQQPPFSDSRFGLCGIVFNIIIEDINTKPIADLVSYIMQTGLFQRLQQHSHENREPYFAWDFTADDHCSVSNEYKPKILYRYKITIGVFQEEEVPNTKTWSGKNCRKSERTLPLLPQEASHVQRAFPEFRRHFMQKERRLGQRTQEYPCWVGRGREET